MKALLALDLGTTTGFKCGNSASSISGTWDLKPRRHEGGGMRYVKLRRSLDDIKSAFDLAGVVYEEVRRHRGTDAAHVYGGLMGKLTEWCEEHEIPYEGVPVGEIKKHWTGKGNASKEMMINEAIRRGDLVADDNEADACAIWDLKVGEFEL